MKEDIYKVTMILLMILAIVATLSGRCPAAAHDDTAEVHYNTLFGEMT